MSVRTVFVWICSIAATGAAAGFAAAREPDAVIDIWPGLAPGETTADTGATLPRRPDENPPATRVKDITRPQLHVYLPSNQSSHSGAAVLILPGGGYNYVVRDKDGSEAAQWLNGLGIAGFVVHYRTKREDAGQLDPSLPAHSERPLQDAQRAASLVRSRAAEWKLDPSRIGVLGFSAGGQAAALLSTRFDRRAYEPIDAVDQTSCRPDFSMLVYPWRLWDEKTGALSDAFPVSTSTPPAFLVHAHDDSATSLSSVFYYAALRRHGVSGELHIYKSGGHGYGMRPVDGSSVDTWTDRAEDWLRR